MEQLNYTYKVKCRNCGKIEKMYFGLNTGVKKEDFIRYVQEHSTFPIELQCKCDNGSIMFHDIVSYNIQF